MINRKLIEKYLFGELNGQTKINFESNLATDEELQKDFLLSNNLNNAILEQDVIQLRSTIQTIMNDNNSKRKSRLRSIVFWPLAAAIMAMLMVYFFATRTNKTLDPQILFAEYYQSYPAFVVLRNETNKDVQNLIYSHAFLNYENKQFEEAIRIFENIINDDRTEIMAAFYLSISQIEVGNFNNAKQNLLLLTQNKDHLFYEQSMWYLALVNLRLGNTNDAKKLLEEIIIRNQFNAKLAKSILNKLD
ncbi:MAG: tetratricopeptide repeat protein [Bacteroidales bacterium]|nr:tetratricopeptide repeat protein [Bacteroidales bacterium]